MMTTKKMGVAGIKPPQKNNTASLVGGAVDLHDKPDEQAQLGCVVKSSGQSSAMKNNLPACTAKSGAVVGKPGQEAKQIISDQSGVVCFVIKEGLHLRAVPVESKHGQAIVRQEAIRKGKSVNRGVVRDLTDDLIAHADAEGVRCKTYHRIAPCDGGVEVYLGDEQHTRVRVTDKGVAVVTESSDIIFRPSQTSLPMPRPAGPGSVEALKDLMNVSDLEFQLLLAWVTYTLSRPKIEGSKYVFLVLSGDQGSGKSFLSNILSKLIDPSSLGIQAMPSKATDLALIMQSQHVVVFDNMRNIRAATSDLLCMASTGGVISDRKLYTDSDISTKSLHGAIIFNGIHRFLHQADLAQRCLNISLDSIVGKRVRSEHELLRLFEAHQAEIFAWLLDLMAGTLHFLKEVEPKKPERMIDFCYWLAAFERAAGLEEGVLQTAYSENLSMIQLDTLMENVLSAEIIQFCEREGGGKWSGTPTELYRELSKGVSQRTQYSKDWPANPIALGKRLTGIKSALERQGVHLEVSRGRQRVITLHIDTRIYPER